MSGVVQQAAGAPAGEGRARIRRYFSTARWIVSLALGAILVTLVATALGLSYARQSDDRRAEAARATVQSGIAEFRGLFTDTIDLRFVRMVEQTAGLNDVRFETEPEQGTREMQPVVNAGGRIIGFLTWQPDAGMTEMMTGMLPVIGGIAFVLIGFAVFALRQLRRARRELDASEQEARRATQRDALTGLPTHNHTLTLLDEAMRGRRESDVVSLGLIEIDGLDAITAQYGLQGNEDIVALAATNIKDALPEGVVCGRAGDSGFALILGGSHDTRAVMRSALAAAAKPYWLDTVVRVSAHGGYAQAPRDAAAAKELARRAELALRAAAHKGPGALVAFDPSIDAAADMRHFIRRELPRALAAGALEVHYQPVVTADGASIVGVEALLRWTHSERGAIPPATFVPVAEQMGLMDALGAFVLRRALQEAKRWPSLYVAVNLSPLQIRDAAIVDLVRDTLRDTGVAPRRLILEVTEGVLIDDPEEMIKRIEQIRALGVRFALDDFGSGYSNLSYLQRFAFDKLKVDRSFVAMLGRSSNAAVIVQAIVTLGRALGMTVVVEGVETEEQRVLLRLAGCDEMQGFLFAKPAPASVIERLVTEQQSRTPRAQAVGAA